MERVGTLVQKLTEQYRAQVPVADLLQTTQCLLQALEAQVFPAAEVRGRVSVVLPPQQTRKSPAPPPVDHSVAAVLASAFANSAPPVLPAAEEMPAPTPTHAPAPTPAPAPARVAENKPTKEVYSLFSASEEPTVEVMTLLEDSPIRDLRKAITLNERQKFIRDLFRDDDNTFDRSIRTINSFNIYAEAQYWIQRELKVKLGWEDHPETAQQFDHLVKRRFS